MQLVHNTCLNWSIISCIVDPNTCFEEKWRFYCQRSVLYEDRQSLRCDKIFMLMLNHPINLLDYLTNCFFHWWLCLIAEWIKRQSTTNCISLVWLSALQAHLVKLQVDLKILLSNVEQKTTNFGKTVEKVNRKEFHQFKTTMRSEPIVTECIPFIKQRNLCQNQIRIKTLSHLQMPAITAIT